MLETERYWSSDVSSIKNFENWSIFAEVRAFWSQLVDLLIWNAFLVQPRKMALTIKAIIPGRVGRFWWFFLHDKYTEIAYNAVLVKSWLDLGEVHNNSKGCETGDFCVTLRLKKSIFSKSTPGPSKNLCFFLSTHSYTAEKHNFYLL